MRKVLTTYGNPNLSTPAEYEIGIEETDTGKHYVKVHFTAKKAWKRTINEYEIDKAKELVTLIVRRTKTKDFPFEDGHGVSQWKPFDPTVEIDF